MIALLITALAAPSTATGASSQPTQACFEILADAEGEMARATDPQWRAGAVKELAKMRAERQRRHGGIDDALAKNAKARDRLQSKFDRGEIDEDDFNSERSEIEAEVRRLIEERNTPQIPACGL